MALDERASLARLRSPTDARRAAHAITKRQRPGADMRLFLGPSGSWRVAIRRWARREIGCPEVKCKASHGLVEVLGRDPQQQRLEGPVGFEPTTRGLKVPCSAAELRARPRPYHVRISPSARLERPLTAMVDAVARRGVRGVSLRLGESVAMTRTVGARSDGPDGPDGEMTEIASRWSPQPTAPGAVA